jgi:hypothetical protein
MLAATAAYAEPSLTVRPGSDASDLDLEVKRTATMHIVKVGEIVAQTTNARGCTVSALGRGLTSARGTSPISLQIIAVGHGAPPPSPAAFVVPAGSIYRFGSNQAGATSNDLYIRYQVKAMQEPGLYGTTIDLDVNDN